ncbi:sugar ABC transporter permease [Halocella sp. SP3-1]|uniref:carbohydrate ABC transporter permease n=1 Tax=Halocella sp. SP3-1 TaxID=2382161 RepID=UPI000F75A74F|nr:sugar ABC transporter permease [Halocella sp. SP3-1]AZO93224.1 sugar ABC transporter permease [Halocella sp. SP3-1]
MYLVNKFKNIDPKKRFIFIVLVPALLFFVFFSLFPILYAFFISFHEMNFLDSPVFVGLSNYKELLNDQHLFNALSVTTKYAVSTVFIGGFLALVFALLINSVKKGAAVFRAVYFLPVMTSLVAVGIIWSWLYQPRFGLLNSILNLFGIGRQMWLSSPDTALPSAIAASIWQGMGFTIVIFLAGLKGIPESLYEAAEVDGASKLQKIWYVTIPLLRPTFIYLLITGFITGFQVFDQLYVMSGPLNSTRGFIELLYVRAFSNYQMGRAAAMAFLLFAIIVTLTLIQFKFASKND